jgi:hypothetical protein
MNKRLHIGIALTAFGITAKITLLSKTIKEPAASITLKLIDEINDARISAFRGLLKGYGFAVMDEVTP